MVDIAKMHELQTYNQNITNLVLKMTAIVQRNLRTLIGSVNNHKFKLGLLKELVCF